MDEHPDDVIGRERSDHEILDPNTKRHTHLDMIRILCVMLVAIDHGEKLYSQRNVFFSQCWVLQLLHVVCGMSWSLNSRPMRRHLPRLAIYFVVGVVFNFVAVVMEGVLATTTWVDVVFQFWFLVALVLNMTITAPLKAALSSASSSSSPLSSSCSSAPLASNPRASAEPNDAQCEEDCCLRSVMAQKGRKIYTGREATVNGPAAFGGVLLIVLTLQLSLGAWLALGETAVAKHSKYVEPSMWWFKDMGARQILGQIVVSSGIFLITHMGARLLLASRLLPWLAWVLLLYVYTHRGVVVPLLYGRCKAERPFVALELFIVGMTAASTGMARAAQLSRSLSRYWFIVPFVLAVLWDPRWTNRFDQRQPTDYLTTLRVSVSEAVCIVVFLVAGDRLFDPKIFSEDNLGWLGDWALFLFLGHKGFHRLARTPWNWFIFVALLPIAWCRRSRPMPRWWCAEGPHTPNC